MNLLLRADADVRMGTGHVMRCLALAQAWHDAGSKAYLATACLAPGLEARWTAEGIGLERLSAKPASADDAEQTISLAGRLGVHWVVVDGYAFGSAFQRVLKRAGLGVLAIDDYGHADHYWADCVLNQNLHAQEALYAKREPYTRLLLGTRFALLRREFNTWHQWKRDIPEIGRKVLVTLGGSDPDNVTGKIIDSLHQVQIEGLEAVVVAGASNPHLAELEAALQKGRAAIRLRTAVTDMPGLMAWADVAVAAGGTTSWERALMGLPSLTIILAENQRALAETAEQAGIGWNLGPHQQLTVPGAVGALERLLTDAPTRTRMARRGPELVDGLGAPRVVRELQDGDIRLRPACIDDCRLIWEWANEPAVRAVSFTTEAIPWERHAQWFAAKLNDPGCAFFIALNGAGVPVGQVRADVSGNRAVISISVDARLRGSGYGTTLIRKGAERLFQRGDVETIHAYIRHGNQASLRAFEKAGFSRVEETSVHGHPASLLVFRKCLRPDLG